MRKIAIVGAGQAGLLAAHALNQKGYDVTLYSDKTPEQFLTDSRPTGTAARFKMALDFERELGLEHWGDVATQVDGVHLTFCPKKGNQLVTVLGRLDDYFLCIDLRLQSARWMRELEDGGGNVEIQDVTVEQFDDLAAEYDLTIVAAGHRGMHELFPRDDARSTYAKPQRFLCMINFFGADMRIDYAPWFTPIKFNFYAPHGEFFIVPWYHKSERHAMSMLFEAKEGGPIDRFRDVQSGEEALETAKRVLSDLAPWDYPRLKDAELCDQNAWLKGSFTPEVRQVVGTLPSGRNVMALGDTAQSLDPIGGQGANNGNKMTRNLVDCIVEHEDRPFDVDWMRNTYDRFWERHRFIDQFNNTLLEPITAEGKMLLAAQCGSTGKPDDGSPEQRMADAFTNNFNDPRELTEAFHDKAKAKQVLKEIFGSSFWPVVKGNARIAKGQLRQLVGLPAGHPGMP